MFGNKKAVKHNRTNSEKSYILNFQRVALLFTLLVKQCSSGFSQCPGTFAATPFPQGEYFRLCLPGVALAFW
jgi:hypothetical protein